MVAHPPAGSRSVAALRELGLDDVAVADFLHRELGLGDEEIACVLSWLASPADDNPAVVDLDVVDVVVEDDPLSPVEPPSTS